MGFDPNQKIETKCVQGGWQPKSGEPRVLPIYESTTFKYDTSADMAKLFVRFHLSLTPQATLLRLKLQHLRADLPQFLHPQVRRQTSFRLLTSWAQATIS